MTFAEFEQLPDSHAGRQELHHGELFLVPPPKHDHHLIQQRLRRGLGNAAGDAGEVSTEMGFRPLPEHEYWVADVAFVSRQRWDRIPRKGNLQGAPELVIEVLSPSNTAAEIRDKKKVCLENGSVQFWVVDIDLQEIEVSTPDGHSVTYKTGEEIPLFFGGALRVDAIFSEI
jgi:Uma2 family endonuclease